MTDKILNFQNVNLRYGWGDNECHALSDINLSIHDGEHCAILGANGSGKSSLIKLISSQIYPSIDKQPTIRKILGQDSWSVAELRQHIGIITNDLHNIFLRDGIGLTGFETVMSGFFGTIGVFPYQIIEESFKSRTLESMNKIGISHLVNKQTQTMSTGELRRCLVARALVHPLKAILLDEPTVGLDIKAQYEFINMMRQLSKNGTTIILVTHHIDEIFEEIEKVILIKEGSIWKEGKKSEVLTNQNLSYIFDFPVHFSYLA